MAYTPKSELDARILRLRTHLAKSNLDGALIVQNADLFYFAGTTQQSHLYVPLEGLPLLMTRKSFRRATVESALQRVIQLTSPRDVLGNLQEYGYPSPKRIGMELDVLPTNMYMNYRSILAGIELSDISPSIRKVRAVKSDYELAAMRRAARIGEKTMRAMPKLLVEGISEIALAGQIESVARSLGHQGLVKFRLWNNDMFYGHLMAGKSAAQPSYLASPTGGTGVSPAHAQGPSWHKIRRNEPVLLDYVFVSGGYIVDQTRIFVLGGLSDKLRRAHDAMIKIQNAVADAAKPGVTGDEIYQLANGLARQLGYEESFGGLGSDRITFVGHGVGLELDEFPFLAKGQKMPLEKGMVIAVEPKVSFANLGTVGIENTFVVTERGAKRITRGSDEIGIVSRKGRPKSSLSGN